MRTITFYVFVLFCLTGCSKYQLVTMNSAHPKDKHGSMGIENDTLIISYTFSGIEGPASVKIINKTPGPLYVRWRGTSMVKETWPSNTIKPALFTADARGALPDFRMQSGGSYNIMSHGEQEMVIQPHSAVRSRPINLRETFFHLSTPSMKNGELNGEKMRFQYFNRNDTPLLFSGCIEWSVDEGFSESTTISNQFWVDGVIVTMAKPQYVPAFKGRDDSFYLRKGSGFGTFMAVMGFFVYLVASQANQ